MKKHIFGLALFSFIVSATVVVYAIFNVPEIVRVYEVVSIPQYVETERTYCNKREKVKINSIEIKQAVLGLQTKQFNWELATPDGNKLIALHFFSKDASGTRYITSEQINNKFSHNGVLKFSDSYSWLNKRNSYKNLYVIAQLDSEGVYHYENYQAYGNGFQPKFDAAKATAVTLDYGK